MDFLDKLGIDIKLLIAQIINFGILLWLLSKFLYKPIINKIEKDEEALRQAKVKKVELDKEKETLNKQLKEKITEAKKESRRIIKEAEHIAQEIKRRAQKEAEEESTKIIQQEKKRLQSQRVTIRKEVLKDLEDKLSKNLQASFQRIVSTSNQSSLLELFFDYLTNELSTLPSETVTSPDTPPILEATTSLRPLQKDTLQKLLLKRYGTKVPIKERKNAKLILGYRLEISGVVIESNLLSLIKNATEIK